MNTFGSWASFELDDLFWVIVIKEEDFKARTVPEELEKILSQTDCDIGS